MNEIPFRDAVRLWVKIAVHSFGGPAGQIAVMHKMLVEEKKWISENKFLHALNYCMLLPGPEAQQLATYTGYQLHGIKGGLTAGGLFILPGFLSILVLSIAYSMFHEWTIVQGLFFGIKPAVFAVVAGALLKISARALKNYVMYLIAVLSFTAIFFAHIPFPYIILIAGSIGFIGGIYREDLFLVIKLKDVKDDTSEASGIPHPSIGKTLRTVILWGGLWFIPVALLFIFLGRKNIFVEEAIFFSKSAVVTFGGAYSVLAYIAQRAVETYHWLNPGEMLDGLGMAETTPGPLIQVVQFVGYMGAFRNHGSLDPLTAGIAGSVLVTWVTFIPCFLFIFAGAPYIQWLEGNKKFSTALSGITAAVVGVIANLSVWFALHLLFKNSVSLEFGLLRFDVPVLQSLDISSLLLSITAFIMYFYFKLDMIKTILYCAAAGMGYSFLMVYLKQSNML